MHSNEQVDEERMPEEIQSSAVAKRDKQRHETAHVEAIQCCLLVTWLCVEV